MHINDLKPGRMVEYHGQLHLIESVKLEVILQHVETSNHEWGSPGEPYTPVYLRIAGDINDPQFDEANFTLLYRKDEL